MSQSNILEKVEKDIESYGWHVLAVFGGDLPNFSYTIGFKETLSHPEIVMSGLSTEMMHDLRIILHFHTLESLQKELD